MMEISASILGINEESPIRQLYDLEASGINYFHIDVMDGKFVKNNTTDKMIEYLECLNSISVLPLDIHLMVSNIKEYIDKNSLDVDIEADGGINLNNIEELKDAGCDIVVVGTGIINSDNYKETIGKMKS